MDAKFKFDIDEKVKTVFDEDAIIDMAGIDNTKQETYYVKLKGGQGQWLKVDQLKKI